MEHGRDSGFPAVVLVCDMKRKCKRRIHLYRSASIRAPRLFPETCWKKEHVKGAARSWSNREKQVVCERGSSRANRQSGSREGEKPNRLVKYVFGCAGADYPTLSKTADDNRTGSREKVGRGCYLAQSWSPLRFRNVERQRVALEYVLVIWSDLTKGQRSPSAASPVFGERWHEYSHTLMPWNSNEMLRYENTVVEMKLRKVLTIWTMSQIILISSL